MGEVRLNKVEKRFGDFVAVNDLDLLIEDHQFTVIVGPSGCGKSTTLRMVAGLEDVTSGEIYINDKLVNHVAPKDRDIAMVFQNYALYPHMNVYDNMAFGLKLRKFPKKEIETRVNEAAEILGIHELLYRKPKALSGGQRQRVAVGRAIVRRPQVFLFDEPLSNLDAKLRVQMRAEISRLHEQLKTTTIYVTHDQVEAMTMGDRIVILKDGLLQQIGSPLDIYEHPANVFVAGFIGSPAMNFFEGVVKTDGDAVVSGEGISIAVPGKYISTLEKYDGKKIIFGIRPEDIYDAQFYTEKTEGKTAEAQVEVIEPMGAETYLHLIAGNSRFVARVAPKTQAKVFQNIKLIFDNQKLHFFDPETEIVLH